MFIAALFTAVQVWIQTECQSQDKGGKHSSHRYGIRFIIWKAVCRKRKQNDKQINNSRKQIPHASLMSGI